MADKIRKAGEALESGPESQSVPRPMGGLIEETCDKPGSYQILNHCCFGFPASKTGSKKFLFITPSKILFYRSQNSKQRPLPGLSTPILPPYTHTLSIYTYAVHSHHPVDHTAMQEAPPA